MKARTFQCHQWPDDAPVVAVIMGSRNDQGKIVELFDQLEEYKLPYVPLVISAHRHPDQLDEFIKRLEDTNIEYIIAVAGMAAALGGAVAAKTSLPVFGIPVPSGNDPDGQLAKFAMSEMPPGVTQVAVLADNVKDNCRRIINLIARLQSRRDPDYFGLSDMAQNQAEPEIPLKNLNAGEVE